VRSLHLVVLVTIAACRPAHSRYWPTDPALRDPHLSFYPARSDARAFLFFFGNDVGFWEAHERLAMRMTDVGIAVVGFDVRALLTALPEEPAHRAAAFADTVGKLIAATRRVMRADSLPVLVGGHSIGAEFALYVGAHVNVANLKGVLALSPGIRGHLRVSLSDLTMSSEPEERGSFAVADEICMLPAGVRVALIRGGKDKYRSADSAFMDAGGGRLARWQVPFSGHSLKGLTLAWPMVAHSLDFLLTPHDGTSERPHASPGAGG
jgi:type IV secretory pathway VirJ component